MKQHSGSHFSHALKMLLRNRRSYGLLSVTIVMSFAILLGYLCFTDSNLYDKYKGLFAADRSVMMCYSTSFSGSASEHFMLEKELRRDDPDCYVYHYYSTFMPQHQYRQTGNGGGGVIGTLVQADITFLPRGETQIYKTFFSAGGMAHWKNTTVLGREGFGLVGNEAIIDETSFYATSPNGTLPYELPVTLMWEDQTRTIVKVKVVGVCENESGEPLYLDENGNPAGCMTIYLSQEMMGERTVKDLPGATITTWCRTDSPNTAAERAKANSSMVVHSASQAQDAAIVEIRAQKATKGVIAIVLMLLLGINLYSSFTNSLNERKFEIGVKRAMGASPWHIMLQFLTESLAVMLMNILLSMILVADVLALYKLYCLIQGHIWVMDISPYSIAMFLVCSISLTVVFSFLFAWKSTRVEIVQYLKAE